jgi:hypothetical protein
MPMMWRTPEGFMDPCCGFMWPPICRFGALAGARAAGCGGALAAGPWAVSATITCSTPGSFFRRCSQARRTGSIRLAALGRFGFEDEGHAVALHVQRTHQVAGHHVAAIGQGQAGQGLKDALAGLAHVLSFLARRDRSAPR